MPVAAPAAAAPAAPVNPFLRTQPAVFDAPTLAVAPAEAPPVAAPVPTTPLPEAPGWTLEGEQASRTDKQS
jgi:hypothetical protein